MKPCKAAYKIVRDTSAEIFKGFGFKHLSDATQYYVHPNNQSYKGTTTLCQPIGEAVMLMVDLINSVLNNENAGGDILYDDTASCIYMDIPVPEEWRTNNITCAHSYRAYLENDYSVRVGAYDANGRYIVSNPVTFTESFKITPVLAVLVAKHMLTDERLWSLRICPMRKAL